MSLKILQTTQYISDREVTNDDLAKIMSTSNKWILSRTNIEEKYLVYHEQTSDLATGVAKKLL